MSWVITPSNLLVDDQDALTYLAAVETADGQALESGVRLAVNAFVKGCKADGIWPAIKASCILAGARTLNGALVPLVGAAPTNVGGVLVSGDYNRKTGLVGDGSTKYLLLNRSDGDDPLDSIHVSIYRSTDASGTHLGGAGNVFIEQTIARVRRNSSMTSMSGTGFVAAQRISEATTQSRVSGATTAWSFTRNAAPTTTSYRLLSNSAGANYSAARLAFYSIGESLDLALLDARVTDLINAIGTAIP
jgi:hypothetical protein